MSEKSAAVMKIKCEYQNVEWFYGSDSSNRTLYACVITSSSITKENIEITAIEGVHHQRKTDENVEAICFNNTVVEYFPRGLQKLFPRLIALQIANCGLREITRYDLKGFENLEILDLPLNQLTLLPNDLFSNVPNLKNIRFYKNKIRYLSSKLFQPLTRKELKYVDFKGNDKIHSFYCCERRQFNYPFLMKYPGVFCMQESVATVAALKKIIDENCDSPHPVAPTKDFFLEKMSKGFESMWTSGKFSDFTVLVGSKKFNVHKNVLALSSSKFEKMFLDESLENETDQMNIEDLNEKSVEDFLRFCYTGSIRNDMNAVEVFSLASKLDVLELKTFTEDLLVTQINEINAFKVFCLGHAYNSDKLKRAAFKEVINMFPNDVFPESLMENVEAMRGLIEIRTKYASVVNKLKNL